MNVTEVMERDTEAPYVTSVKLVDDGKINNLYGAKNEAFDMEIGYKENLSGVCNVEVMLKNQKDGTIISGFTGYGEGEWIRLDFDSIYTVEKIKIVNGLVNKKNGYYNNNRPKSISLRFSDGSRQTIYLEDDNTGYQVVNIDPVDSNYIEFTINSVYYGTKYDDTCIADIEVLGY